jgi:hypothetical protein
MLKKACGCGQDEECEKCEEKTGFGFTVRKWAWKFFGALFMRDKGSNGEINQAVSSHKLLGLGLFLVCTGIWLFGGVDLTEDQKMYLLQQSIALPSRWGTPPDELVYSWWALLGVGLVKGGYSLVKGKLG